MSKERHVDDSELEGISGAGSPTSGLPDGDHKGGSGGPGQAPEATGTGTNPNVPDEMSNQ